MTRGTVPSWLDPGDDDGEDLGELGRDNQHALGVGFRRHDVQERDQLGTGQLVADEAVVGQFGEFLDPDAGVAEQLNAGPCPERVFFFFGQVPPFPVPRSSAQILGLGSFRMARARVSAAGGELLAGRGGRCRRQPGRGPGEFPFRGGDQAGQYGQAFAGPLVRA